MGARRALRAILRGTKRWLDKGRETPLPDIPFDNRYTWLNAAFLRLNSDPACAIRPQYTWGILQGVALAKVLGIDRVSVVEFGVAGGAGLIAMEQIAANVEKTLSVMIDIYGFDSVTGIPKSEDYRDCPNIWLDGMFPMDREELEPRLHSACLKPGLVKDTVPVFIESHPAPRLS
jgi:hypothetical protein